MSAANPASGGPSTLAALQNNDKAVKYGSIIIINHFGERNGILMSDGFVDMNLYLGKPRNQPNMSLMRGLFIVLPPFYNEGKKKIINKITGLSNVRLEQRERSEMLEKSRDSLMNEYNSNLKSLTKLSNEFLSCNSPFQLMHFASNRFLSSRDEESEVERENRK